MGSPEAYTRRSQDRMRKIKNALRQWAKRETDPNVIGSIYYGCALPEDLEKEVGDILSAAQAQITAIINKLSA